MKLVASFQLASCGKPSSACHVAPHSSQWGNLRFHYKHGDEITATHIAFQNQFVYVEFNKESNEVVPRLPTHFGDQGDGKAIS